MKIKRIEEVQRQFQGSPDVYLRGRIYFDVSDVADLLPSVIELSGNVPVFVQVEGIGFVLSGSGYSGLNAGDDVYFQIAVSTSGSPYVKSVCVLGKA